MARMGTTSFPRIRIGIGAGRYIYLPVLTTTQRNLLSASAGYLIYNSTTGQVENYNGSSWVAVGTVYGDATFLKLAGGTMTGNIAMAGAQTVDGVDISVHASDIDAHMGDFMQLALVGAYVAPFPFEARTYANLVADTLYATPIMCARSMTFSEIAFEVRTGTTPTVSNCRMGLHADNGSLAPGAELYDWGTVVTTTSGKKSITTTFSLTKAVLYWLALVSDGTPEVRSIAPAWPFLGFTDGDFNSPYAGYSVAFTYGALPDPFPAGAALKSAGIWMLCPKVASLD